MDKKVTCIDACPGTGKTTYAIQMFNARGPEDKFLYITPYLDEVERIQNDCHGFIQPLTTKEAEKRERETGKTVEVHPSIRHCKTKGEAIHQLVTDGQCITSTHALFRSIGEDTMELLRLQGYTLVMDEVLSVIESVNTKAGEVKAMFDADVLKRAETIIEGTKIIKVIPGGQDGFRRGYEEFREIAGNGRLVAVDDAVLVWLLPPDLLDVFNEVYVMTYMFECQPIAAYFEMFKIPITMKTMWNNKLVEYSHEIANSKLSGISDKIHVHEKGRINDIGNAPTALSSTWFTRDTKVKTTQLGRNLVNFFHKQTQSNPEERLWTVYKDHRSKVEAVNESSRFADGFLSNNVRATNEYDHKSTVAYCCNFHMHPYIKRFFKYGGVDPHEDQWALSEMLQWLFRSRIRKDKAITVYVPAKRMRDLLKSWLKNVDSWTEGADQIAA